MSGGVDSSVAAALLKQQGYDCVGIFMKLWHDPKAKVCRENLCCSTEAYEDARKIAHKLGFPIYTFNYAQTFKQKIVNKFLKEYQKGKTPNPCIDCNKYIKFDLLLKTALKLGCNYLATGHYLKIAQEKNHKYKIFCASDKNKDQSYFLYNLKQDQLAHLIFPLGKYQKSETRKIAEKLKLPVFEKPDSQEICFISESDHYSFLKRNLKLKSGPIKNLDGKILGQHQGLALYTLGQRKGIKVGGTGPYYVVKIDKRNNTLYISNNFNEKKIYHQKFKIKNINWISGKKPSNKNLSVKIRYQAKPVKARIEGSTVYLKKTQRAVMPGQSAVFYAGKELLGGGIIA